MTEQSLDATPIPTQSQDWTSTLTPDLKMLVEAKGYKSPADVVQAYAHAQRLIGVEKIPLPKDGVWDETAREKLGIPKAATEYELSRPEMPEGVLYDDAFEKAALPIAHKLGLTPTQVQGLLEFYAGHQTQTYQSTQRHRLDEQTMATEDLKSEWGANYETKVSQAARAARYFGGEDLITMLNDSGLGNNPNLVRAFSKVGAMLSEDTLKVGAGQGLAMGPDEALRQARKLMSKPAYGKRDHPDHSSLVEKVQRLFEQAYRNDANEG